MRGPHNLWRLIRTGATFERTGAMRLVLEAMEAPPSLRIAARVLGWPFQWLGYEGDPTQPPILRALTALGPAYIKFGQLLSTRPDVVGADLARQLTVLQDKLPPFPLDEARASVAHELGQPVEAVFSDFSEPIAAASLAQVHRATMRATGQDVAVKVLRPGIERAFLRDVDAFYFAARMIETLAPFTRRLRPRAVIAHFEGVVQGELDLRMEAAAAAEFRANIASRRRFPRAGGDLAGDRPPRPHAGMGLRHQHGRPAGARRPAAPISSALPSASSSPSCATRCATASFTPTCTRATSSSGRTAPSSPTISASWAASTPIPAGSMPRS